MIIKNICSVCGKEYKQSKNPGFCSSNCKTKFENSQKVIEIPDNITDLGKK